jgi:hypothetical protein
MRSAGDVAHAEAADPRFSEMSADATKQCRQHEPARISQSNSAMTLSSRAPILGTCLTEAREAAKPENFALALFGRAEYLNATFAHNFG